MRISCPHRWSVTPEEAIEIQRSLAPQVIDEDVVPDLLSVAHRVAGVDVHQTPSGKMRAVVCVLTFPELIEEECISAEVEVSFPYIPGLLAFREGPAVLKAFEKIKADPDFILWDAQGRAHQRRIGLASQMGLILDIPSIGCAKSILYGEWTEPKDEVGSWTPITDPKNGDVIGATLRTKKGVQPVFVSVGHKVSLNTAIELVLKCCAGYRIPEPLRCAHRCAKEQPRGQGEQLSLF
ncbi:MAG: deoxyribonuclease V [Armatimonadota bacterium]|nr:deoxyribonuclease V [Armatimonadota bacterium]MCX7776515.1 deoxyribonuclease V [Armatimonadota bacterium]MDW8024312.1 deoxyribonuclease V [Armatimonadota bacterium]